MDEARKTNILRGEKFRRKYFTGHVIDIGCGRDLVVPHAVPFDVEHGDAQWILNYFQPETFDCVHSSHCLEHMRDVEGALAHWWALVKPAGHLIIVVPHEDLYEQGAWPSLFNPDHKATFNLGKQRTGVPNSFDLEALIRDLPGAEIIAACAQDHSLDHGLVRRRITRLGRLLFRLAPHRQRLFGRLMGCGFRLYRIDLVIDRFERLLGKPVDQTLGPALAQIQVVARKTKQTERHTSGQRN